uniref:DNA-3-methyladenine glycosylase II n=1 Tax=Desulfovibrio sp. U5L TaxID=596152 RepID=I2Q7A1_9BACT
MKLDPAGCYRAFAARDARFDGRFFAGVTSTGIYCRPVCTARLPREENCRFFPSAAAAEGAGFRPCLICRPEVAPGLPGTDAGRRLAFAAVRLINEGVLESGGLTGLCARLGVTSRHLRRVFGGLLGVSPVAFAQTQRLLLAKSLLTDTAMPVTDVAYASGFSSLRRFNALFRSRYGLTPTAVRKNAPAGLPDEDAPTLTLGYRPPYDWDGLLGFLALRRIGGVETTEGGVYRRTLAIGRNGVVHAGWLAVAHAPEKNAVRVTVAAGLLPVLPAVLTRVSHLFDLCCDPAAIAAGLAGLADGHEGLRLPGAADGFEVAVRAILGQQVTVAGARTLARRFAAAFGDPVGTPFADLTTVFPGPARVAGLTVEAIASLGIIAARARAIIGLARAMAEGGLVLSPAADVAATRAALLALPGIGAWTAEYIAMRALAWPDAFPHTDFGVKKALGETDPKRVLERAVGWRPWRAYAVMHLWRSLSEQGGSA